MDEKRFLLARLLRQGLREVFEGVKDSLSERERERVQRRLDQYMALGDQELCWLLGDFMQKGKPTTDLFAGEAGLYLIALDFASTLLDLPEEVRLALKNQLAQRLGVPSA